MVSVSEESGSGAGASLGGTSVAVWMSPDSETGSVESFGSESAYRIPVSYKNFNRQREGNVC